MLPGLSEPERRGGRDRWPQHGGERMSTTVSSALAYDRDHTADNNGFDPFRDLTAPSVRPDYLGKVNLRALSPFHRALLAIDGTVTKFLEAYALEPVEVVGLKQEVVQLASDHPSLEAACGTEVVTRRVLLQGCYSSDIYAYAASLLVMDRLPADLLYNLSMEPGGLGRALLNGKIESRREILGYGRERGDDLPAEIVRLTGNEFVSRTYRIIAGGRPMMLINEKFPLSTACPSKVSSRRQGQAG